jgi:hypothetical protein
MKLEIVCQAAPHGNKANEDAYLVYEQNDRQPRYILAVIDGATSVAYYEPLMSYLRQKRNNISPAALSAAVTRNAMLDYLSKLATHTEIDPYTMLLYANQQLRELLDRVAVGIYDASSIIASNPAHAEILSDPRKIRLYLPAAVATVAVVDTEAKTLTYGHIGDTALLVCYPDGHVEIPTENQVRSNSGSALFVAIKEVAGQGLTMLEVVQHPLIQALNRDQRIYHNYVDEQGKTTPHLSTGVINGLPELADYIKTGMISLDRASAVILASDGFFLPDNPLNPQDDLLGQTRKMWATIHQHGAAQYLQLLRAEEYADTNREKYPRLKLHDDATGIVLTLDGD